MRKDTHGGLRTASSKSVIAAEPGLEQCDAPMRTLEERVFEGAEHVGVACATGSRRATTGHPALFTVDLLGSWCKP